MNIKISALILSFTLFGEIANASDNVIGNVDGFYSDANGNPVLSGWTCQVNNPDPIQIDLYLNAPYSPQAKASGELINRFPANNPSEPALASACGTHGDHYRFAIALPSNQFLAGEVIYVYGVDPDGGTPISPAKVIKIPANTLTTNSPGSVKVGPQFVVYDTFYDSYSGCAPLLDAPLYPVSFNSPDGRGAIIKFSELSGDGKNLIYLASGEINSAGAEIQPFQVSCIPVFAGLQDPTSIDYDGNQWLAGFFKDYNGNVFSLVHNEYYGGYYPDQEFQIPSSVGCSLGQPYGAMINPFGCTYAALEMAEMPEHSSNFHLLGEEPPRQVIAHPSFGYTPNLGRPAGYFINTNIIYNSDGYYYALAVDALPSGGDRRCPIRTNDIADPSSWRGWDGTGFTVDFANGADCVDDDRLKGLIPFYLGYSTFFRSAIMVGATPSSHLVNANTVIAYSLSTDFVHWSQPVSFTIPVFNLSTGPGWSENNYPSLVDVSAIQNSQDPNWSTGAIIGRQSWLVFEQIYTCAPAPDANCPAPGMPLRTRYAAVAVTFSK